MNLVLLLTSLALLSGCMSTGRGVSDSRSAWININDRDLYWCEAKEGQKPVCEKPIIKTPPSIHIE